MDTLICQQQAGRTKTFVENYRKITELLSEPLDSSNYKTVQSGYKGLVFSRYCRMIVFQMAIFKGSFMGTVESIQNYAKTDSEKNVWIPEQKIVVVTCDPASRAYSDYKHMLVVSKKARIQRTRFRLLSTTLANGFLKVSEYKKLNDFTGYRF